MVEQYIKEPFSVVQDKRFTSTEKDYLCLIGAFERNGGCTASNNYIANLFGVKRQTAQGIIRQLKTKKAIDTTEEKSGGKTVKRTITIIDPDSRKALLSNSRKPSAGLAGNSDKDSRKLPTHILKSDIKTNNKEYTSETDARRLSELLMTLVVEQQTDFREGQADRKETTLQRWTKDIDRMIRLDRRSPERIEAVIRWTRADSFWQSNILSASKLREKFDTLELQSRRETKDGENRRYNREIAVAENAIVI